MRWHLFHSVPLMSRPLNFRKIKLRGQLNMEPMHPDAEKLQKSIIDANPSRVFSPCESVFLDELCRISVLLPKFSKLADDDLSGKCMGTYLSMIKTADRLAS